MGPYCKFNPVLKWSILAGLFLYISNVPCLGSYIPSSHYGVFVSHLERYARTCPKLNEYEGSSKSSVIY